MVKRPVPVRREEILIAAVDQLVQRGVSGTRASDVARALGVSNGLIFYHFESKDHLVAEAFAFAVDRGLAELRAIVEDDAPVLDRIAQAISLYGPDADARGWRIWIDGWSESLRNEPLRETIVRLDDEWGRFITALIGEGVDAGVIVVSDTAGASVRIRSMLDGVAVQAVLRGDSRTARERRAAVAEGVIAILGLAEQDAATMRAELSLLR